MKEQEKIIKIVVDTVESYIISGLLGSLSDGFWENDEWVEPYWMNLDCGYSNHLTIYYCNKKEYDEAKPYPLFDAHIGKTFEFFADRLDELSEWKYACDIPELEEEDYKNDICSASLKNLKLVYDNWRSYSESSASNSNSETIKPENVKKVSESVDNDEEYADYIELIDDTINKIKKGILNKVKNEVEEQTQKAIILQKQIDNKNNIIWDLRKQITNQIEENNKLKIKLDEKFWEIPQTKFKVGDAVYVVRNGDEKFVYCPTCAGKGNIQIQGIDGNYYNITCPDCGAMIHGREYHHKKYNLKTSFYTKKIKLHHIDKIHIIQTDHTDIVYNFNGLCGDFLEDSIFAEDEREKAEQFAQKCEEDGKKRAYEEMGIEYNE